MLGNFSKAFIIISILAIVFKIEFFPFSNYQMYSRALLPKNELKYLKLKGTDYSNVEKDFINKKFFIFHGEQPFLESIYRNNQAGKDFNTILGAILSKYNVSSEFKELNLYALKFDWVGYKKRCLENNCDPKLFIAETKLIGSVKK